MKRRRRLSAQERDDMTQYLVGGGFYTADEVAQLSDQELFDQFVDMQQETDEMEAITGYDGQHDIGQERP